MRTMNKNIIQSFAGTTFDTPNTNTKTVDFNHIRKFNFKDTYYYEGVKILRVLHSNTLKNLKDTLPITNNIELLAKRPSMWFLSAALKSAVYDETTYLTDSESISSGIPDDYIYLGDTFTIPAMLTYLFDALRNNNIIKGSNKSPSQLVINLLQFIRDTADNYDTLDLERYEFFNKDPETFVSSLLPINNKTFDKAIKDITASLLLLALEWSVNNAPLFYQTRYATSPTCTNKYILTELDSVISLTSFTESRYHKVIAELESYKAELKSLNTNQLLNSYIPIDEICVDIFSGSQTGSMIEKSYNTTFRINNTTHKSNSYIVGYRDAEIEALKHLFNYDSPNKVYLYRQLKEEGYSVNIPVESNLLNINPAPNFMAHFTRSKFTVEEAFFYSTLLKLGYCSSSDEKPMALSNVESRGQTILSAILDTFNVYDMWMHRGKDIPDDSTAEVLAYIRFVTTSIIYRTDQLSETLASQYNIPDSDVQSLKDEIFHVRNELINNLNNKDANDVIENFFKYLEYDNVITLPTAKIQTRSVITISLSLSIMDWLAQNTTITHISTKLSSSPSNDNLTWAEFTSSYSNVFNRKFFDLVSDPKFVGNALSSLTLVELLVDENKISGITKIYSDSETSLEERLQVLESITSSL